MTTSNTPSPPLSATPATGSDRKRPPRWIILGILGLFACWFAAMQWRQRAGEPVQWEHDLRLAEQHARDSKRFTFLMLQAPDCPIAAALDRDLFSQLDVREKLAQFVCCRLELRPADPLALRYDFSREPIIIILKPGSERPLMRPLQGKVQYPELDTLLRESLKARDRGL